MRRSPTTRRPMAGLRRPGGGTSSTSSSTTNTDFRSTLCGSMASHGPRFKRCRLQSGGVKEVPEANVAMVEEEVIHIEECYYMSNEIGTAIVDSGATRTIVGEEIWKSWLEDVVKHGQSLQVLSAVATTSGHYQMGSACCTAGPSTRKNLLRRGKNLAVRNRQDRKEKPATMTGG